MRMLRTTRSKEEILLIAVSGGAAAVVVSSLVRDGPASPALRAATAVALLLSLTTAFAFWFSGAVGRRVSEALREEHDATRGVLAAIPEGLLVVGDGRVLSVNRRLCELLGYERDELVGATAPFPFWPPEHRHEIERWHAALEARGEHGSPLVFLHRRDHRIRVLVAGSAVAVGAGDQRHVLTVRDVSASHRRGRRLAELSTHDPQTSLLNERGFEQRLGDAVRRAIAGNANVTVAVLELGSDLDAPVGLIAVERLRALIRAGEDLGRTKHDELAWLLPETSAVGAVGAVARARAELTETCGLGLTAGVCDLATAGDALALYALADRALAEARREGVGGTATYPRDAALGRDAVG